ncbi:hypothetical protein EYC80_009115 [Monilinia laxa]|uniref:Uncharacterized protein n=1 Tax=Monilinia laxa TaxID=61186 RepID=A0A5N6K2L1_MONLA|nr:hypothetical protein EYC80_009115 [Monilinia laxa]
MAFLQHQEDTASLNSNTKDPGCYEGLQRRWPCTGTCDGECLASRGMSTVNAVMVKACICMARARDGGPIPCPASSLRCIPNPGFPAIRRNARSTDHETASESLICSATPGSAGCDVNLEGSSGYVLEESSSSTGVRLRYFTWRGGSAAAVARRSIPRGSFTRCVDEEFRLASSALANESWPGNHTCRLLPVVAESRCRVFKDTKNEQPM